ADLHPSPPGPVGPRAARGVDPDVRAGQADPGRSGVADDRRRPADDPRAGGGDPTILWARPAAADPVRPVAGARGPGRPRPVDPEQEAGHRRVAAAAAGDGRTDAAGRALRDGAGAGRWDAGGGAAQLGARLRRHDRDVDRDLPAELLPGDAAGPALLAAPGVAAAARLRRVHPGSDPEPAADGPARAEPEPAAGGGLDAEHAVGGAGGAQPGVRPGGAGEGPGRSECPLAPRPAERGAADRYGRRDPGRGAAGRDRDHRADLQPAGDRALHLRRDRQPRLPGRAGGDPRRRRDLRPGHAGGRHPLRRAGPAAADGAV
ncbi:MAG: Dipeptide transport system permease protein DppB, partial [uncultured Thermomicrobiales bacterium]